MKFVLDTADLDEIREALSWGAIDGVTRNSSLFAKTGGKLANSSLAVTLRPSR